MAKVLQELQELTTDCANKLRSSRTEYDSDTNPNICKFVAIRGIRGLCGIGTITMRFETLRDKTEKVSCSPREDSDQHSHPPTLICVLYVRCIDTVKLIWKFS